MCLLVLAWHSHPRYRLIVAANRDEFHDRPAAPLAPWADDGRIIAGRDAQAGGTWLGIDRLRRFGTVTNYRELQRPRRAAPSRGGLIPAYLASGRAAREHVAELESDAPGYSGFNLLLADAKELWYASNRADVFSQRLAAGIHGLANRELDAPSPKLLRVRRRFEAVVARGDEIAPTELFAMLADRQRSRGEELPSTERSLEWEQALSAPFVVHDQYGTRCSTVVLIEHSGATHIAEHRFDAAGQASGQSEYALNAGEWPDTPA